MADLETRVRTLGNATTAALDTHLARLDALHHQLAHPAWPHHEAATNPAGAAQQHQRPAGQPAAPSA
ncbi:hypothetical protein ACIRRH_24255 [Kitasatospora sp. NPDC101235]|uniref:hypothetical protein n=1 Tax=Kitasatospora sp. NPDC101235 TaxID=3364101 RepID=UPI003810B562